MIKSEFTYYELIYFPDNETRGIAHNKDYVRLCNARKAAKRILDKKPYGFVTIRKKEIWQGGFCTGIIEYINKYS